MKKKLLFLLVPMMAMIMTGCVKYNGQGKNGSKSSKEPQSQQSSESSGEPASSADPAGDSSTSSQSGDSSSSSSQTPTPEPPVSGEDLPEGTAVKVYLVFGEYGLYKGNSVNTGIDSLFLEHTIELQTKVGADLPGKADVTSSVTGSEFVSWTAYNNDGKLTEYTKVPAVYDKILYASFSGGNGQGGGSSGGGGGGQTPDPEPPSQDKVTINFSVTYHVEEGTGVYLVGDFCEWKPDNGNAIKFDWSEGDVWVASREIYKGTTYRCKLVTAPYNVPSYVYTWEKEGEGNERQITFNESTNMNLSWGNY